MKIDQLKKQLEETQAKTKIFYFRFIFSQKRVKRFPMLSKNRGTLMKSLNIILITN